MIVMQSLSAMHEQQKDDYETAVIARRLQKKQIDATTSDRQRATTLEKRGTLRELKHENADNNKDHLASSVWSYRKALHCVRHPNPYTAVQRISNILHNKNQLYFYRGAIKSRKKSRLARKETASSSASDSVLFINFSFLVLFASCEKQTPTKVQCKLVRCREGNVLISPTSDRQMQAQNSFPPMSDNLLWMLLINLRLNEIIQMTGRNFLITIYMPKVAEKEKKAIAKGSKKKLNKSRTATLRNKIK